MFSKTVLKKMVQELSVPTLVTLTHESLEGIGEELSEGSLDVIANIEMFATEMKRRITPDVPQQKQKRSRPSEEAPPSPAPEKPVLKFVVGGEDQ